MRPFPASSTARMIYIPMLLKISSLPTKCILHSNVSIVINSYITLVLVWASFTTISIAQSSSDFISTLKLA
jgi:hypothetical protein